jgi:hypothetical protein
MYAGRSVSSFVPLSNERGLLTLYLGSIVAIWSYVRTDAKTNYRISNTLNNAMSISILY